MKVGFVRDGRIYAVHFNAEDIPNLDSFEYVALPEDFIFEADKNYTVEEGVIVGRPI